MTDMTNPRAALDDALAAMRSMRYAAPTSEHITMRATVVCAEALALLVDAHLTSEPESEPEPEPDLRENLPDDTPVGNGWVAEDDGRELLKPERDGSFTRWLGDEWGAEGIWEKSELNCPRPATVGDLRREGVPVTDWPDITEPEPEPTEPPDGWVVLMKGQAWQRIGNHWYVVGAEIAVKWDTVCAQGTPTVIYTPKEESP